MAVIIVYKERNTLLGVLYPAKLPSKKTTSLSFITMQSQPTATSHLAPDFLWAATAFSHAAFTPGYFVPIKGLFY